MAAPDYRAVCEQAAKAGGRVLLDLIGRVSVREKGPADLVTEADCASQDAIGQIILNAFPDHGLISEEGPELVSSNQFTWIVDPLDGTTNYVHGFPFFAVSIALVQNGSPLVGVVFDPTRDECFSTERGKGATLNGKMIAPSQVETLPQAMLAANFSARVTADSAEMRHFTLAALEAQSVRRTGSAALNLAYVAAGRLDGFWAISTKQWDVAAGVLLVQESGGCVTDFSGAPFELANPHPLAGPNALLHAELLRLFRDGS